MLRQCSTITTLLLIVAVISKISADSSDVANGTIVQKLVDKAFHWRNVASSGVEPINVYHHLVSSLAFMQAAREVMPDAKVELLTGVDVSAFVRRVEQHMTDVRQNIVPQPGVGDGSRTNTKPA